MILFEEHVAVSQRSLGLIVIQSNTLNYFDKTKYGKDINDDRYCLNAQFVSIYNE